MSDRWFYLKDGKRFGPFGAEQFRQLAASGLLQATDMVLEEASGKWTSAGAVAGLFPESGPGPAPAPADRKGAARADGERGSRDRAPGRGSAPKPTAPAGPAQPKSQSASPPAKPSAGGSTGQAGSPPAKPLSETVTGLAGVMIFALVVSGLVSLGVLPTSCAKKLPYVGRHYAQFCESCNGTGEVKSQCWSCYGRGYYDGSRCPDCGGSGKTGQVCQYCAGSGKKPPG